MKWNKYIFSLIFTLVSVCAVADDSIPSTAPTLSTYDMHVQRYRRHWESLIPKHIVIQNAGNMGALSVGTGWDYGKNKQWETQLLFGYVPKHQTPRAKLTMTVKENYVPFNINLNNAFYVSPLTASIYINTIYGHEFWKSQPDRYPKGYYDFMSTKFRINIAVGQRITWRIPYDKRRNSKSISLFYEVSTCDLYIRSKIVDGNVPLKDILGLSLGIKMQTL